MILPALSDVSSANLISSITRLRGQQRIDEVQFLWLLAEVDARGSFAELGYGSLWDFCQKGLSLTNGAAGRRITAARLLRAFPAAADYLADGRLGLTTLGMLKPLLDAENHVRLFDAASFKNEREVDELVRTHLPLTFVRDTVVRKLQPEVVSVQPATVARAPADAPEQPAPASVVLPPVATEIRAVDAEYVSLTMRVPKAFMDDLAQVTAALSHVVPTRKPQDVLRELMRRALAEFEKKKGRRPAVEGSAAMISSASSSGPTRESATPAPVVTSTTAPRVESSDATEVRPHDVESVDPRRIPRTVIRAIWTRDGGSCTFVGATGRRCGSTHQLEVHHRRAAAFGGPPTLENLTIHCRVHNALEAQRDFGAEFMRQFRRAT